MNWIIGLIKSLAGNGPKYKLGQRFSNYWYEVVIPVKVEWSGGRWRYLCDIDVDYTTGEHMYCWFSEENLIQQEGDS